MGVLPFDLPEFDAEAFFEFDTKTYPRTPSAPLPLVGRGWGWGWCGVSQLARLSSHCTTPTPPAFAALRRATLPTRGRVKTECAARADCRAHMRIICIRIS